VKGFRFLHSPRNIFPHLTIRAKLLIAFAGLSVVPVLCVSLYGIYVNVRTTENIAFENLTHDVTTTRGRASNFLANVEGDIRLLLNSTEVEGYIRTAELRGGRDRDTRLRELSAELVAFARTKEIYYQIRVIDDDREEALRIESDDILDSVCHFSIVPPAELRRSGQAYYFLLTENLHRGEIVFSPVELTYRGAQRLPVLSFATPLFGPTKRVGLLIANVFAGNLFKELEAQRNLGMNETVVLVSSDGHYLYNSVERGDWNRLIALGQEDNLQKDYPPSVARMIISGNEGIITGETDKIIAYAPLLPLRGSAPRGELSPGFTASLYIFESVPRANITRDARASAMTFVGFLIVFFGGALGLGLLATRQFTRPISEVRRGADVISRGNYRHRLNVETGDEIEALARQFNVMAASLEAHEREIQEHRSHLEEMVDHRTRELVEQKGKLQAILDNVPSAFVMLDETGRIQTASAAFASITGLILEEVRGKESSDVFRTKGLCQMAGWGAVAGKIEGHIDQTVDESGAEQFLEHITIPIAENGEITAILQIITNITKRKRLEEHLIHSEKLMVTGEMAAIIAHGFRNSLTSIKMILQLQQESKQVGRGSRRSLRVALDSISRMETVVQELLNFARPSPMVFGTADLNTLIDQALALLDPRLKEHRVSVRKSLDLRLPPMTLDAAQVRESIVNLLLNGYQAIESQPPKGGRGKITIATKRVVLQKTLRDYHSPDITQERQGENEGNGREIVLRKGRECVRITITDNGPGIDHATIHRIFDPFFTTKTNGTGLGLPMVKRAVNAHGGVLSVKSSKGKVTTFEIILPLHYDVTMRTGANLTFSEGKDESGTEQTADRRR
jgi:PAS domain S-box-containing protein